MYALIKAYGFTLCVYVIFFFKKEGQLWGVPLSANLDKQPV